jgi:hypothetical protein
MITDIVTPIEIAFCLFELSVRDRGIPLKFNKLGYVRIT